MKLRNVKFIEQYLDKKPTDNYWRGINVLVNGINLVDITLIEQNDIDSLIIELKDIPYTIFSGGKRIDIVDEIETDDWGFGNTKFRLKDKERAKNRAKQLIENYFSLFVK